MLAANVLFAGPTVGMVILPLMIFHQMQMIAAAWIARRYASKIEAQALKQADDWLEEYRRLWEQRLDRLEDYLRAVQIQAKTAQTETAQAEETKAAKPKGKGKSRGRKK